MDSREFHAWLEGFLEGKDKLGKRQIELIKEKSAEVYVPPHYHYYNCNPPYIYPWITWTGDLGTTTTTTEAISGKYVDATPSSSSSYLALASCVAMV